MSNTQYPEVSLFIAGCWTQGADRRTLSILNPATGEEIGRTPIAERADLDCALMAARTGFAVWRKVFAFERYQLMRKAADILRARADSIARTMTLEQGKPLGEARGEIVNSAKIIDWFAEEGRRAYARVLPVRKENVGEVVLEEPVGTVAAFSPWNFPVNQAVLKVAPALAAGCSVIIKGPEETPASCAELVRAFADAGLPPGVLNLVFGVPADISEYLIANPIIRKISFTGSTRVGKRLARLAGQHMKRMTMELGGHAPAIIFEDADIDSAVKVLTATKFHNAGQVCISPTRFLVHEKVADEFTTKFIRAAQSIRVGDGFSSGVEMGPLANARRLAKVEALIADAVSCGATLRTGGERIGNKGFYFAPTVLSDVPTSCRIMNEEPFGPVALINSFEDLHSAFSEANRLAYGLAAYAHTRSEINATSSAERIEAGVISINHHGIEGMAEMPFGGVKDSGYGSEGGIEGIRPYLATKFVTRQRLQ